MKHSKHTPGPWKSTKRYNKQTERFQLVSIESESGRQIAIMSEHHGDTPLTPMSQFETSAQDDADAHLIAAAPEMLEALEAVRDRNTEDPNDYDRVFQKVLVAITKAKGGAE